MQDEEGQDLAASDATRSRSTRCSTTPSARWATTASSRRTCTRTTRPHAGSRRDRRVGEGPRRARRLRPPDARVARRPQRLDVLDLAWSGSTASDVRRRRGPPGAATSRAMLPTTAPGRPSAHQPQARRHLDHRARPRPRPRPSRASSTCSSTRSPATYEADYAPDATAPVISDVTAVPGTDAAGTFATVTWTTDDPRRRWSRYGTTALDTTVPDADARDQPQPSASGLTPGATYQYRVSSTNAVGLTGHGSDRRPLHVHDADADAGGHLRRLRRPWPDRHVGQRHVDDGHAAPTSKVEYGTTSGEPRPLGRRAPRSSRATASC